MGKSIDKRKNCLPDTFLVAFFELLSMSISNVIVFLIMYYVIWPNKEYNKIYNNGFGPFHGWRCGDKYENSGHWILISGQIAAIFLYSISLIFLVIDYYLDKHGLLNKYKVNYSINGKKDRSICWKSYRKAIFLAKINGAISFIVYPLILIPLMEWRGNCDNLRFIQGIDKNGLLLLYDIFVMIIRLIITALSSDIIFYFTHRCCHEIKFIYHNIHKTHHQFVETFAISATASHPIEHIFVNLSTVIGSAIVSGLPLIPYFVYVSIGAIQTVCSHSGYSFGNPFIKKTNLFNAVPHDFHHKFQNCDFGNGANQICDYLFKTRLQDIYPKRWRQLQENYGIKYQ